MRRIQTITGHASIVRRCGEGRALSDGKLAHRNILLDGYGKDLRLTNLVIQMFGRCNSPADAREAFNLIPTKNVFSWSIMIHAYTSNGHFRQALDLFQQMEDEASCEPGEFIFSGVLDACGNLKNLELGKCIHDRIHKSGIERNVVLETSLLKMYTSCGCTHLGEQVFEEMKKRDIVSWNAMIAANAKEGHCTKALKLFWSLFLEALVKPNYVTFASILPACWTLDQVDRIHLQVTFLGLESNIVVVVSLMNTLSRLNQVERARGLFDALEKKNLVAWNSMIAAYAQRGDFAEAQELFQKLDLDPDEFTFASILPACCDLELGKQLHARLVSSGLSSSMILQTALVNMYARCGSLNEAMLVFKKMEKRDLVSWNSSITALAQGGHNLEALELYRRLVSSEKKLVPNSITFASVLAACSSLEDLEQGRLIHADASSSSLHQETLVESALVNMYSKCGSLIEARVLFDKMVRKDVVAWNAMIAAYAQAGHCKKALGLYQMMEAQGSPEPDMFTFASVLTVCAGLGDLLSGETIRERMILSGFYPDVYAQNALLIMYARCGSLSDAKKIFDMISEKDVITWNSMISACSRHGEYQEALETYNRMTPKPDEATYVSVLCSVSALADLSEGKRVHEQIKRSVFDKFPAVESAVMNMYAKCGSLEVARGLFEKLQIQDMVSWNSILTAYAQHGDGAEALELYLRMELDGVEPNGVTFAGILASCIHVGLLDKGVYYTHILCADRSLAMVGEHYRCMVDLLGRSGRLEEAETLIVAMPFEPEATVWMTLLGACKLHGHLELAERVAKRLDPDDAASYVLLSNVYSTSESEMSGEPRFAQVW